MEKPRLSFEEIVIAAIMCIMVLMVAVHVFGRYVAHSSFSYTEELVRYLFVWATFLGVSAAIHRKRHLSIAGSFSWMPSGIRKASGFLVWFGSVTFAVVMIIHGVRVVALQIRTGQTSAALGFPMWIMGLAIPCCMSVVLMRLFLSVRRHSSDNVSVSNVTMSDRPEDEL